MAWLDLARVHPPSRRWQRLAFPAVALALLVPVAVLQPPQVMPAVGDLTRIRGGVPPELAHHVIIDPDAPFEVSPGPPVVVTGSVPPLLRRALDTLPGEPVVRRRSRAGRLPLPSRSLLVGLLAVSLLTGPLAESLPAERSARTLEVLRSAGISGLELLGGKWLAWTVSGTLGMLVAAVLAAIAGNQPLGPWILTIPAVVGVAVALGLWLSVAAADVVVGATRTLRVLPLAAMITLGLAAGVAWFGGPAGPWIAAAVPLGGPLLVVGAVLVTPGQVALSLASSVGVVAALLIWAVRHLDDDARGLRLPDGLATATTAAFTWWMAVAGPTVWAWGGRADVLASLPATSAVLAGSLLLGLVGAVELASRPHHPPPPGPWAPAVAGLAAAAVAGAALGLLPDGPTWAGDALSERFAACRALPAGHLVAFALGHGLLATALVRRQGTLGAALWAVTFLPAFPLQAAALGAGASVLGRRGVGGTVAFLAGWALAGSLVDGSG